MSVDRQRVSDAFEEYTDKYNLNDTKIRLKAEHTFKVAALSDEIARSLKLDESDVDLAWTIGMLHDIGRFEQVKRYNTFSDAQSIDHAQFGADLLFKEGLINLFLDSKDVQMLQLIEITIRNHSAYRIDEGLNDRQQLFCNIIRDADKIDILRVNAELPIEEIYNVSTEELINSSITAEVEKAFYEKHAVLRSYKKTPVDNVIGHISLVYELQFEKSFELAHTQGYIYKLVDFKSKNEETTTKLNKMKSFINDFIRSKVK